MTQVLSEFELQRLQRIRKNQEELARLVSPDLRQVGAGEPAAPQPRVRRAPAEPREPAGPPRRSARAEGRPAVNYAIDLDALERKAARGPRHDGPPRFTRKRLTLEELEAMTEEEREAVRAAARGARAGAGTPACMTLKTVPPFASRAAQGHRRHRLRPRPPRAGAAAAGAAWRAGAARAVRRARRLLTHCAHAALTCSAAPFSPPAPPGRPRVRLQAGQDVPLVPPGALPRAPRALMRSAAPTLLRHTRPSLRMLMRTHPRFSPPRAAARAENGGAARDVHRADVWHRPHAEHLLRGLPRQPARRGCGGVQRRGQLGVPALPRCVPAHCAAALRCRHARR
jgi:hypothetical protein